MTHVYVHEQTRFHSEAQPFGRQPTLKHRPSTELWDNQPQYFAKSSKRISTFNKWPSIHFRSRAQPHTDTHHRITHLKLFTVFFQAREASRATTLRQQSQGVPRAEQIPTHTAHTGAALLRNRVNTSGQPPPHSPLSAQDHA